MLKRLGTVDTMGTCQSVPLSDKDAFAHAGIVITREENSEKQTMYELNYMGHVFQFVRRANGSTSLRNMRNNERCSMETVKNYVDTIQYVAQHNDYPVVNIQVWHSDIAEQRTVHFHFNEDNYGLAKLCQTLKKHMIKHSEMNYKSKITQRPYMAAHMTVSEVEKLKHVLTGSEYQWIDFTVPRTA
jgi:hypothetical protein